MLKHFHFNLKKIVQYNYTALQNQIGINRNIHYHNKQHKKINQKSMVF